MRLAHLLAELPPDELERLGAEHLGQDEKVSRAALCVTLEGVLRSYSFVRKFVADRFPPTFAILDTLLDAAGWSCPASTFREVVTEKTARLVQRVAQGELVARDQGLRLYRRVLLEARRNDLVLDASEAAILGVLRRELEIRPVEHFLVEHHEDFGEFWDKESAFLHEMNALRSAGLVFGHDGNVLLAEEVVPMVMQAVGLEMSSGDRRRAYSHVSGGALGEVLGAIGLKTSGSRDEKLERLLISYVQPSEVLGHLSLQALRDLCREVHASVSGSKDELVERLVGHFLHDLDLAPADSIHPEAPKEPEPRALGPSRFRMLFAALKGNELTDILAGIESSRVTGAKETKVALVVASSYSEASLLDHLTSRDLEDALARLRLKTAGAKRERIDRLVEHYRTMHESLVEPLPADEPGPQRPPSIAPPTAGSVAPVILSRPPRVE
jgi:hypothetical protein